MLLWIALSVVVLAGLLTVVAVGIAAGRSDRTDSQSLGWLLNLRSASGRQFFASPDAARRLFGEIEEIEQARGPARGQRPSA
jgi:hypothetical protein